MTADLFDVNAMDRTSVLRCRLAIHDAAAEN